jgi:hypothetical protein
MVQEATAAPRISRAVLVHALSDGVHTNGSARIKALPQTIRHDSRYFAASGVTRSRNLSAPPKIFEIQCIVRVFHRVAPRDIKTDLK